MNNNAAPAPAVEKPKGQLIKTTELPLVAKLMSLGDQLDTDTIYEIVQVNNRPMVQFHIRTTHPEAIDAYQTGRDGIANYEACRRTLMRMCSDALKNGGQS